LSAELPASHDQTLAGWGNWPRRRCAAVRADQYARLVTASASAGIARGLGRAYGDAALCHDGQVVLMERLDHLLALDEDRAVLRAEAGTSLSAVLDAVVPRGFFVPVTPGTCRVTLGGCVAADVHGKNHHHNGTFTRHVESLNLLTPAFGEIHCSDLDNPDLFHATCGGMGLTGIIGEIALRLRRIDSAYVVARHRSTADLDELVARFESGDSDDEYTVSWLDALSGRGIFMAGHHAARDELPSRLAHSPLRLTREQPRAVSFTLPFSPFIKPVVAAFNALYRRRHAGQGQPFIVDYRRYFHPLDGIEHWNRLHGRRGFTQYQCVLPSQWARDGLGEMLRRVRRSGVPPTLAVLKRMGAEGPGLLSFPRAGYTLALDLPVAGEDAVRLATALDEVTLDCGGRVYLAKDACLKPDAFRAMYPRYSDWLSVKRRVDPYNLMRSALSARLEIARD
jgi:FAD/FMN-containing dehydrogenase